MTIAVTKSRPITTPIATLSLNRLMLAYLDRQDLVAFMGVNRLCLKIGEDEVRNRFSTYFSRYPFWNAELLQAITARGKVIVSDVTQRVTTPSQDILFQLRDTHGPLVLTWNFAVLQDSREVALGPVVLIFIRNMLSALPKIQQILLNNGRYIDRSVIGNIVGYVVSPTNFAPIIEIEERGRGTGLFMARMPIVPPERMDYIYRLLKSNQNNPCGVYITEGAETEPWIEYRRERTGVFGTMADLLCSAPPLLRLPAARLWEPS